MRATTRMRLGAASMLFGLALIGAGIVWIVPDYVISAQVGSLADEVRLSGEEAEAEAVPSDAEVAAAAGEAASETERAASGIDWATLRSENGDTTGWISVPTKSIDFPVMHGTDNEYYLHHDMYGRWGYGGVFSDYRCDPNGRNVNIYGHTLIGGGMFTKLGTADEPGQLATIGPVTYSTPEAGAVTFTPIATLHVYPSFQDVQTFSWDVSDDEIEEARHEIAQERAQNGEWNLELPEGMSPEGQGLVDWWHVESGTVTIDGSEAGNADSSATLAGLYDQLSQQSADDENTDDLRDQILSILASNKNAGRDDGSISVNRYYVASGVSDADARARAEKNAWREWLVDLVSQGTQISDDAADQIANASRSLCLCCCSWPFDSHRTIVVCVAS